MARQIAIAVIILASYEMNIYLKKLKRVESLLLHVERSQLWWFGHLVRIPPECLEGCFKHAHPGGGPHGRPRKHWRGYVYQQELEEVA